MTDRCDQILAGWGNYPRQLGRVHQPDRWRDATDLVCPGRTVGDRSGLISRGLGRSYGDASLNAGRDVLCHRRLNRILRFDAPRAVVECEAGVSFADLLETCVPRGLFPPVTPGTRHVTLGGALAADVHGKNHHCEGSIAHFVERLTLLTGRGDVITCAPDKNADAFRATLGGMGLTGAILTVALRLRPIATAYLRVDQDRLADLDQTLQQSVQPDRTHTYAVAWIDCLARGKALGRSVLMRGEHATPDMLGHTQRHEPLTVAAPRPAPVPCFLPARTLNATTVAAFNELYYRRHPTAHGRVVHYEPFFYPLDKIRHWNRIYGRRGFVQYQLVLPPETARDGLVTLLETIAAGRRASFLAVLKAFGDASEGMLSFPRRGVTLSLDLPADNDIVTFTKRLDRIVLEHGGRVYLAKDACLDAATFAQMYPALRDFQTVKARLDPEQRFTSSLARRLGIAGEGVS